MTNTCNGRVWNPCVKVHTLDGVKMVFTVVLPSRPDDPDVPADPEVPDEPDVPEDDSPNVTAT